MLVLVCALMLLGSTSSWALWDENAVYEPQTQTIKIHRGTSEGVLLLKEYKFGRPVFLYSSVVNSSVERTQMVSETTFYRFYQTIHALIKDQGENSEPASCEKPLSVTRKLESKGVDSHRYCLESFSDEAKRSLEAWFSALNAGI